MTWLKPFIHWGFLIVQLITSVLALLCWNKSKSIAWRFFIIIWLLTFLTEAAGKIIWSRYGMHNLWLYNFFDVVFYPGIALLYTDVFAKSRLKSWVIAASATLFIWAVIYLLSHTNTTLNTFYTTVASAIIIFFALIYLIKSSLDKETTAPLRNDYYYWFSAGFFIYFTFIAIMIGMYTTITKSKVGWLPDFIFYANHLVTLVLHICLWAGFTAALKWMK